MIGTERVISPKSTSEFGGFTCTVVDIEEGGCAVVRLHHWDLPVLYEVNVAWLLPVDAWDPGTSSNCGDVHCEDCFGGEPS